MQRASRTGRQGIEPRRDFKGPLQTCSIGNAYAEAGKKGLRADRRGRISTPAKPRLDFRSRLGTRENLVELKEFIGPGRWQIWVHANFHELGHSEESRKKNAQRCIRFWKDNAHLIRARNSSFSESDFSTNSMRTFMWDMCR